MNCPKCEGEMWDNRVGKKNPKAPDFKCKDKDCDGVIWPPRGAKAAQNGAPQAQASAQRASAPSSSDDRSNRIERQHSQHMALLYLAMRPDQTVQVSTETVRSLIDWFQRDVGRMPAPTQAKAAVPQPEPEPDDAPEPSEEEEF